MNQPLVLVNQYFFGAIYLGKESFVAPNAIFPIVGYRDLQFSRHGAKKGTRHRKNSA